MGEKNGRGRVSYPMQGDELMRIRELEHQSIFEEEGLILQESIKLLKPKYLFESGTNNGYATGWILNGMREAKLNDSVFHSCDPRRFPIQENVNYDIGKFIFSLTGSLEFLDNSNRAYNFDWCFLDGDHRTHIVFEELQKLQVGKNDTIVFLHDVRSNGKDTAKDPFLAILQYIQKEYGGDLSLFNLIRPGSLATNMKVNDLILVMENTGIKDFFIASLKDGKRLDG
jgi:predicted O-methyltransferase YrrM